MTETHQVEATGETVGEAKWSALRELEKIQPGIDKAAVRFQVVSEGERGLLGVGYAPARVIATVDSGAVVAQPEAPADESELASQVREVLERILEAISVRAQVEFREDGEIIVALLPSSCASHASGRQRPPASPPRRPSEPHRPRARSRPSEACATTASAGQAASSERAGA